MRDTLSEHSDVLSERFQRTLYTIDGLFDFLNDLDVRSHDVVDTIRSANQQIADLHWRIVQQDHHYLIVQCAWCGVHLGLRWVSEPCTDPVSHGICLQCLKKTFSNLYKEAVSE